MKKYIKNIKFDMFVFLIFVTSLTLIYSSYAWFSSSLNVDISNFKIVAGTNTGLSFSLDGENWSNSLNISKDSLITNLTSTYPNHTNQWSDSLSSTSSVGVITDSDKFTFVGEDSAVSFYKRGKINYLINSSYLSEREECSNNSFVAFDLFFKNISNSPYPDNLYLSDSSVFSIENSEDDSVLNAIRVGFVFYDVVDVNSSIQKIQNSSCSNCEDIIFEPFSVNHSERAISTAGEHGINLISGEAYPTYAMVKEGSRVNAWSGVHNSNYTFNDNLFWYQKTITNYNSPLTKLYHGITKARVYLWIEGQDIDIIDVSSDGYTISIGLEFNKDLAGYY